MRIPLTAGLAAVVLAVGAVTAYAQEGFNPDTNGDGKITLAEMQASRVARMMQADTNHDGKISKAEFVTSMQQRAARWGGNGGGGPPGGIDEMFKRQDLNGDGYITKAEIEQATAQRFARMDTAHKGYLTPDEMHEGRPGR